MTIDEAFVTAIQLLNERGEMLNAHLFRLVGQNQEMFRELRSRLIAEGFAEDRSGVGLKAIKQVDREQRSAPAIAGLPSQDDEIAMNAPSPTPNIEEIEFGESISFSEDDFLPLSSEKRKSVPIAPSLVSASQGQPIQQDAAAEPVRVSVDLVADGKQLVSRLMGSQLNLCAIGLFVICLGVAAFQWRTSPDANDIYHEFNQYYEQAKSLRARAVSDPGEWLRITSQSRSRVQSILNALKDRRVGASSQQPEKQELLWAGNDSLSKLLESPAISTKELEKLELQFELHMKEARRLLDGGARTPPEKQIAAKNSPGAGKGYLAE